MGIGIPGVSIASELTIAPRKLAKVLPSKREPARSVFCADRVGPSNQGRR
jgi:hypothetical protein